ncbi:helix-turn-helix domain-containing protein [Neobacillus sp. MM2021_6]|uniref:helix-turn-helix domain-containing protein n=1 Tax=Bacillaceae TaxID=186817 RepID=UPI00140A0010|nr:MULTISPECIES: helix-turn-helix domain-containing protein [Bacillaceae]MBO0958119.1 helix-turn-helix domain-containing protein [Neobacillus sp. MM2021_6]NHC18455.1 RQC domain-containing protein [Bacillus sp. MM2020_4]
MLQLEAIILYCLTQLNNERTIYSIFHLINGKKSSQTIQDAHLFSLKRFFGIYDTLTRASFDEIIQSMCKKEWIKHLGKQQYSLTTNGQANLENNPVPAYLNGWSYQPFTSLFWERLTLFIQVTSNLIFGEARYQPIQSNKDVHQWLKAAIKEMNISRNELGNMVYTELITCFEETEEIDPAIVVFRLTGFEQIGLTSLQTAKKLNMDIHDYHIGFIQTLHYLLQTIMRNPARFRILSILIKDLNQNDELTISSRKTWALLNEGYSPDMIAKLRGLKVSTVEDHFVEFALSINHFLIDPYVEKELQKRIIDISRLMGTRQLKLIKDQLQSATYFQIRLVLAKYGDREWK